MDLVHEYINRHKRPEYGGRDFITFIPNGYILISNYNASVDGSRWNALNNWLNIFQNIDSSHPHWNTLAYRWVQEFVRFLNSYYPSYRFSYEEGFDFDHEEFYWTANKSRKDETGANYYGFNATYIIYREPR
jgi:hypothetical protein